MIFAGGGGASLRVGEVGSLRAYKNHSNSRLHKLLSIRSSDVGTPPNITGKHRESRASIYKKCFLKSH